MDNEGVSEQAKSVRLGSEGRKRFLNARLPRPESQGTSKFKFLLHPRQSAPFSVSGGTSLQAATSLTGTPWSPTASPART